MNKLGYLHIFLLLACCITIASCKKKYISPIYKMAGEHNLKGILVDFRGAMSDSVYERSLRDSVIVIDDNTIYYRCTDLDTLKKISTDERNKTITLTHHYDLPTSNPLPFIPVIQHDTLVYNYSSNVILYSQYVKYNSGGEIYYRLQSY